MTDSVWIAAIAAVPATIAAFGTFWNGRKINDVHTAVNGNLAEVKAERDAAREEVRMLRRELGLRRITDHA